jgi:AcrR family transcriptional regulator
MVLEMNKNTEERIKSYAFRYFLEKGYEESNMRAICAEVDIKASSLYYYFTSKIDLFFRIYDEISNENLRYRNELANSNLYSLPMLRFGEMYKGMIRYYSQDIVKQKFLFRYQLFPPEEISYQLREKYHFYSNEENNIILNLIKLCINDNLLNANKKPLENLLTYKKNEKMQMIEMITYNTKMSSAELDLSWIKIWNSMNS